MLHEPVTAQAIQRRLEAHLNSKNLRVVDESAEHAG